MLAVLDVSQVPPAPTKLVRAKVTYFAGSV